MMNTLPTITILVGMILLSACSPREEPVAAPVPVTASEMESTTHITGTVHADGEQAVESSGFELRITEESIAGEVSDTLFYAVTDQQGNYQGDANFIHPGIYTLILSRDGEDLAQVNLVLADGDTIRFDTVYPDFSATSTIESVENDLYRSYERLEVNLNRVYQFMEAGLITEDEFEDELIKWSDLFWDFHESNRGTFAGREAAIVSIGLLEDWEDELMMERLREALSYDDALVPYASRVGTRYYITTHDFDQAVAFMDTLSGIAEKAPVQLELSMSRIKLLYDHGSIEESRSELDRFKARYAGVAGADDWVDNFERDLTSLAPGLDMPPFEVTTVDGRLINNDALDGTPYVLEFTSLGNALYQQQMDRQASTYHVSRNFGVRFITIAFDAAQDDLDEFFSERLPHGDFARPGSFDPEELQSRFNLNLIPARILINSEGEIVRKYEGAEFGDMLFGLQNLLQ